MSESNRTPEQIARERIAGILAEAGWSVQDKNQIDFNQAKGVAEREKAQEASRKIKKMRRRRR